jgi:hypothetical protein
LRARIEIPRVYEACNFLASPPTVKPRTTLALFWPTPSFVPLLRSVIALDALVMPCVERTRETASCTCDLTPGQQCQKKGRADPRLLFSHCPLPKAAPGAGRRPGPSTAVSPCLDAQDSASQRPPGALWTPRAPAPCYRRRRLGQRALSLSLSPAPPPPSFTPLSLSPGAPPLPQRPPPATPHTPQALGRRPENSYPPRPRSIGLPFPPIGPSHQKQLFFFLLSH